jgi:predicted amidophosphoribosyltransferase
MNVDVKPIIGNWDLGYSLDKHTIKSTHIGYWASGKKRWDTERPEAGEALFQLKYRSDYSKIPLIANQMFISFGSFFPDTDFIVPIPSSTERQIQPVTEIAKSLANMMGIVCIENLLIKIKQTPKMKDGESKSEKSTALSNAFSVQDIFGNGSYNVLIIDDIFDTGATLEEVTKELRKYHKIGKIYVATVTRKR